MTPRTRSRTMIIVIVVAILIAGSIPGFMRAKQRTASHRCGNFLVSIGGAARLWAGDQGGGRFPPDLVSMSNELTPNFLICPGDRRQPASAWASFTTEQSSFEVITPSLLEGDTNHVFLRCKIHGSVLYGDGSVFVNGHLHRKL